MFLKYFFSECQETWFIYLFILPKKGTDKIQLLKSLDKKPLKEASSFGRAFPGRKRVTVEQQRTLGRPTLSPSFLQKAKPGAGERSEEAKVGLELDVFIPSFGFLANFPLGL